MDNINKYMFFINPLLFGILSGWTFLYFWEKIIGKLACYAKRKIQANDRAFFWKTIDFLWRILLPFAMGAWFFAIPVGCKLTNEYFEVYVFSYLVGWSIRLPIFIKWTKQLRDP